jgi:hypothetical protein
MNKKNGYHWNITIMNNRDGQFEHKLHKKKLSTTMLIKLGETEHKAHERVELFHPACK